jgi:copper oxidase (laccase) domain-containing protein
MSYPLGVADAVLASRTRFFEGQGLPPGRMVTFFTEHRDDITRMEAFPQGLDAMRGERLAVTDAVVCRVPGAGVFLTFADCVPFIVYDAAQHIMAFAHIGWRSMALRFTAKVLRHMTTAEGSRTEDLHAYIGPCIKKESYLYRDPVQARDPVWAPYLEPQPDGRVGIDLVGFCLAECAAQGLGRDRITVEPMDTAAHDGQFSHYAATEGGRPGKQGRLVCYGFLR